MQQLSAVKPLMAWNSKGAHLTIASAKPIDLGHRTYIANLSEAGKVMHVLCTSYTECIVLTALHIFVTSVNSVDI